MTKMIEILKGDSIQLHAHCAKKYGEQNHTLLLIGDAEIALPYTIVRLLLPQFRRLVGDNEINRILEKYKLVTSLIFPCLMEHLTEQEKLEQTIICARLSSNITHNRIAKTTINENCVALIMEVAKVQTFKIAIPDVRHLDVGSIDVIKVLKKQHSEHAPDILMGFNPDWGKERIDYKNGLVYYSSVDALINIQAFVYSFEAIADTVSEIETNHEAIELGSLKDRIDILDDAIVLSALELITSDDYEETTENNELMMEAIWHSFKLYDFTMALKLAHPFMEKSPNISRKAKGEMYHIIGLSAHNRQFFSQGNENLGLFLKRMFERTLEYEENPENRVGAIYRLIVTLSRRLNLHEEAFQQFEFAISELDTLTFDPAHRALLKGWVLNINSFVLMRSRRINEAIKYHEDAFDLLKDVQSNIEHLNKEIRFTQAVLAENLTTLSSLINDRMRMKYWCSIEESYSREWPGLSAVPFAEWQQFYYKGFELNKALENAQKGVRKAADNFEYILEYFFTMSLADINIRLGNYEEALTYFKKSMSFQAQLAYNFTSATSLKIGVVSSMIGLRRFDEALNYTKEMISQNESESPFDQIEIYILQAFTHAHLKNFEKSDEIINKAIDLAVEEGNFNLLIHTACKAGDLCQLLGRKEDALNAYCQALEIMESQADATNASNIVEINLGLFEMNQTDFSPLLAAIRSLPNALKTNYAVWQHLNRFLSNYLRVTEKTSLDFFKSSESELTSIIRAAKQREDCKQNLELLARSHLEKVSVNPSRTEL